MSNKIKIEQLDSITEQDLSILLDCEIVDKTGKSVPLNDVSVIISIFDTTQNFIDQKMINGTDFRFDFNNEYELLNYIYNDILDIDNNDNLNKGIYRLKFSFILDTFNSIENENNRFIVTEISPDGSEIRLNPLSNEDDFISIFSRIKKYKKSEKIVDLNESGFISFYREYIDSIFSDSNINDIFSDSQVKVYDLPFSEYLVRVYTYRSNITNDSEKKSDAEKRANDSIDEMKRLLRSKKGDAIIFISKYFDSIKNNLFDKLKNTSVDNTTVRNTIINEFKLNIKNKMNEFLNKEIDEIVKLVLVN